jgi:light-regulated signal transduction histidine kinase (bacteriophytochrome)
MPQNDGLLPTQHDLAPCAQEPIRVPGAIQPFAALLLLTPDRLEVITRSANVGRLLGVDIEAGRLLEQAVDGMQWSEIPRTLRAWAGDDNPTLSVALRTGEQRLHLSGARTPQGLLVELEPEDEAQGMTLDALYPRLRALLDDIQPAGAAEPILQRAVEEMRRLTGFDRVLAYRFDEDGHGTVIAEDGSGALPSYLGHRFPAADILAQARQLYCQNRIRLIPDAWYTPVPLEPALIGPDRAPVDLTAANWRSVSPAHLEYMRNMGTGSSMSVSIVTDGQLWGLISCHSAGPRLVGPQIRAASEFLSRIVAHHIGAHERIAEHSHRIALKKIEIQLVELLSRAGSLLEGYLQRPPAWTRLLDADGAALVWHGDVHTMGNTPSHAQILEIADWLTANQVEQSYHTDRLGMEWPDAAEFAGVASGLAAASISSLHTGYLMWFRPEIVRTVQWRGDPGKPMDAESGSLHPRKPFERWQEELRGRSLPWRRSEIDALSDFRTVVVNLILKRAEERAALSEQLERTNVELESFSYSVSHDLRAPFRHIAGFAQLLKQRESKLDPTSTRYIDNILRAAVTAGRLVDDLLRFSHLGRAAFRPSVLDMNKLVAEVRQTVELSLSDKRVQWNIEDLPQSYGDPQYIRQVWYNLMENAIKYSSHQARPVVSVSGRNCGTFVVFSVADNGVGFDMNYAGKLFGVFQRLHKPEDFDGTGIGLALCKRIIEKHGGWIKGEGAVDQGAKFSFALPRQ